MTHLKKVMTSNDDDKVQSGGYRESKNPDDYADR